MRVKKLIEVERVEGRRGVVQVKVNRRKLRQANGKAASHFEEDGVLKWVGFLELFSTTLKDIVTREARREKRGE